MTDRRPLTREDALRRLRHFGIRGADVYLIDLVPLIEMMWADGRVQAGELERLREAVRAHVGRVNELAGYAMLKEEHALAFALRFVRERPDPALLAELRSLVRPVRLSSSCEALNQAVRHSLLAASLAIAAGDGRPGEPAAGADLDAAERRALLALRQALDDDEAGA